MTSQKIAIIQARMSSSRLPGKVLMDIHQRPMLQHVIERTMRAKLLDDIVVATTTDPSDDVLEQFCHAMGIPCFRGSLPDVLDRYYQAALQYKADVIIRLTADCPLIDPDIIDLTVSAFLGNSILGDGSSGLLISNNSSRIAYPYTFAANRLPPPWKRSLPIGLDVEVCSFTALETAWKQADQPYQREHVMPYLYEGVEFSPSEKPGDAEWTIEIGHTPRNLQVALLNHLPDYGSLRWTVDTPADLEFVRQVYSHFGPFEFFNWHQVLTLLETQPQLAAINADVVHKTAYDVDHRTIH
jgi:spore coat polysaccharide biosynthesis protein SpsF